MAIEDKLKEVEDALKPCNNIAEFIEKSRFEYSGKAIDWRDNLLFIPLRPKMPLKGFDPKISIFNSAKKPIRFTCVPAIEAQKKSNF